MNPISFSRLFFVFLKLGATGFGGPVALLALMEKECCQRLGWVKANDYNETYVLFKLLPGPIAFQMATWVGYKLRGRLGGLVSGLAFLVPGFLLILGLALYYRRFTSWGGVEPLLQGMRVGAMALIFDSVWRMYRPYASDLQASVFVAVGAAMMFLLPRWEPLIIICGGLAMVFVGPRVGGGRKILGLTGIGLITQIFWVHFKAGAFVFGTGLAIVPFLEHEVVRLHGWLNAREFLDAIAFGQVTPGPITLTSVFVGHRAANFLGAITAAVGMYSPGLLLTLVLLPWARSLIQGRAWLYHFQRGAIPMVIGCIVGASITLSMTTFSNWWSLCLFLLLVAEALCWPCPGWFLIAQGCVLGYTLL